MRNRSRARKFAYRLRRWNASEARRARRGMEAGLKYPLNK